MTMSRSSSVPRGAMQPSASLPRVLDLLLSALVGLVWPSHAALEGLLCLGVPTLQEQGDPLRLMLRRLVLGPVYLLLFLLFLLPAVCAAPLRCLLASMRRPFIYSVCKKAHTQAEEDLTRASLSGYANMTDYEFGVASSNVCLLGEFVARINYMSNSSERARSIAERVVVDQFFYTEGVPRSILGLGLPGAASSGEAVRRNRVVQREVEGFVGGLSTHFPRLDFLCLQEVGDWTFNKILRQELHKVFPYILHDVGVWSVSSNYFLLNSGLMLASRHPVLTADFRFYPHSVSQCLFISKGLLMVKVLIGEETDERRHVGYIYTTHLQAYQGKAAVIVRQLDDIVDWTAEFRKRTADSRDIVLFDILTGDLNFDNMSPGDKENQHHRLFDIYHDPCRVRAGQDQPWSVGTEFKQIYLHEDTANSPESLRESLGDPVMRHRHMVDADITEQSMDSLVNVKLRTDRQGNMVSFPEGGMRRIDYVMARKDTPVDITKFQFVTHLASLTDHLPVAMTFRAKV